MQRHLDILALENHRGGARGAVAELETRGHRVQTCYDNHDEAPFPCRGVVDPSDCPLEGPIDVALVVRHHIHPRPSGYESGVACAIRAGIPVVEDGSGVLDPFDAWITARVDGMSVTDTCEDAVTQFYAPLATDIRRRCSPLLVAAGIEDAVRAGRRTCEKVNVQVREVGPDDPTGTGSC